jgi:hypothetical protein
MARCSYNIWNSSKEEDIEVNSSDSILLGVLINIKLQFYFITFYGATDVK